MDSGGHWRRTALGAGGVALLLPFALAIGVAATTALGGDQALSALSQVFAGPAAPGRTEAAPAPGLESARAVPDVPVRRHTRRRAHGGGARRARTASPVRPVTGATGPARRPRRTRRPGRTFSPTTTSTASPAPGPTTTSQPPPPAPPPPPSPLHAAGQQVADAAKSLPAPVGGPVGDAAQTVVDLLP